jgi:1-acyl-sn-glycerol-3-phosphate acyltransferase
LFFCRILPSLFICKRLKRTGKTKELTRRLDTLAKKWSRFLLRSSKTTVTVRGRENLPPPETPVIYIGNHQSFFDIPILLYGLQRLPAFMSAMFVKKWPIFRDWMELFDCVFIDNHNARRSMQAIGKACDLIKNGRSMVIFPEGRRGRGGILQKFKNGAFKAAQRTGVPIVPFFVENTHAIYESNGKRIKPAQARITFLPPVMEPKKLNRTQFKEIGVFFEGMIREKMKTER